MDRRIRALRERLRGPDAGWPFTSEEIAARQADQSSASTRFADSRARIAKTTEDEEEAAALSIVAPETPHTIAKRAAARLLTPAGDRPSANVEPVLDELERQPRKEDLPRALRVSVAKALDTRLLAILAQDATKYPTVRACEFAGLLARWTEGKSPALTRFTEQMMGHVARQHHPRGRHLGTAFRVLDELIRVGHSGAARCVRTIFHAIPTRALQKSGAREKFLSLLANNDEVSEIHKVLAAMFEDASSPWHLSRPQHQLTQLVSELCEAGLLRTAVFRKAFQAMLKEDYVVGHVLRGADEKKTCHIDWALRADHTRVYLEKGEPVGVAPGKGRMLIHHRDVLLSIVTDGAAHRSEGRPAFRIYWPEDRREQARRAWLRFVSKPR